MLCTHPPFQLDRNMEACAGIAELLVQSHIGSIKLLPFLPLEWKNGSVKGIIKSRGGFEVNIYWQNRKLLNAEIIGKSNSKGTLNYDGKSQEFKIPESGILRVKM